MAWADPPDTSPPQFRLEPGWTDPPLPELESFLRPEWRPVGAVNIDCLVWDAGLPIAPLGSFPCEPRAWGLTVEPAVPPSPVSWRSLSPGLAELPCHPMPVLVGPGLAYSCE